MLKQRACIALIQTTVLKEAVSNKLPPSSSISCSTGSEVCLKACQSSVNLTPTPATHTAFTSVTPTEMDIYDNKIQN